jgi:hypothetical protein
MSEPFWVPLGPGAGIDYEGAYSAGQQYVPGDIVTYGGREYIALNPSLGETPPAPASAAPLVIGMGTSLPASPFDGQEFILVDSLTAPTYSWRLRYVAAKATNKWVYIGGAGFSHVIPTAQSQVALNTWEDLATVGPDFTTPVAGDWDITQSFSGVLSGDGHASMSYTVGATPANLDWGCGAGNWNSMPVGGSRTRRWNGIAAGTLFRAKYYKTYSGVFSFVNREIRAVPVAVGG